MRDGKVTKARITQAALALFVEQGVAETTVRDIARAAGVAEGALYRHFAGKEELAWQLFAANFSTLAVDLDRLQAGEPTLAGKLAAMVSHFCTFFDRDPVLFSYLLLAQHGFLKRVTPEMPNPVEVLRGIMAAAMARGEMPAWDPDVAAAMVLGIVLQVAVFKIYGRIPAPLASLAGALTAACGRVLGEPVPL